MSQRIAHDLAKDGYLARTIVLKLRYSDFSTFTRQTTLNVATDNANEIETCAVALFRKNWNARRAVRLIGVGAHNLIASSSAQQLQLQI
jgi:nucleotidyltransferase/DNA polymerase involved in DNA repair